MAAFQFFLLFLLYPLARAASRTSPPAGSIVVRQSGTQSGEFNTISKAIASLSGTSARSIFIYPGTYREQVVIRYGGPLTVYGSTTDTVNWKSNTVTIPNNLNAQDNGGNDTSGTLRALSNDFKLYNVNVANTYGAGKQAGAVSARGTRQGYYGCRFTGYQDTLFADANNGYQCYSNCLIEGAVDYIYGHASAWFGECTISSVGGGAITANSRETTADTGYYVFDHSTIQGASGTSLKGKVYLGRPWRVLARVVYQNSALSDVVHADGWTTMAAGATPSFHEFANSGAGASTSVRKNGCSSISAAINKNAVVGSDWGKWVDKTY
ncbi:pectin methyl esterase [Pterulicium gracile]|uniref:pectinesterase n=1 Tax=Pterulicium gracile TaxID=1884261 RepID=A0A5C3QMG5_9AGAR|nr:pectin methyl esterase [Pterula gracilis]